MDLRTQGAQRHRALQIAVSWINDKVAGTQGGAVSMQDRQTSGEHSDGFYL